MGAVLAFIFSIIQTIFGTDSLNGLEVTSVAQCNEHIYDAFYKPAAYAVFNNAFSSSANVGTYISTSSFSSVPKTIFDLLMPVGICLCVVYWAINLFKTLNYKNPSLEMIYKSFMRLIVGCILISNLFTLTAGFFNFSSALTNEMATALSTDYNTLNGDIVKDIFETTDEDGNTVNESEKNLEYLTDAKDKLEEEESESEGDDEKEIKTENGNGYNSKSLARILLGSGANMLYIMLFQALRLALIFSGMTMTFDLARKLAVAPLACCDVYGPIANNKAYRYVRQLFAICMTQPVALLILVGCHKAMALVAESSASNTVPAGLRSTMVMIVFGTMCGLVMGAKGVSHKLFAS